MGICICTNNEITPLSNVDVYVPVESDRQLDNTAMENNNIIEKLNEPYIRKEPIKKTLSKFKITKTLEKNKLSLSIIHVEQKISKQNTEKIKDDCYTFTRTKSDKVNMRHKNKILQKIEEDVKHKSLHRHEHSSNQHRLKYLSK